MGNHAIHRNTLRKLAATLEKYLVFILLIALVFTAVMAFGSLQMKLDHTRFKLSGNRGTI